jgi:hypothetical protein
MDLPKVRSVVVDPSDPIGGRLILLRVSNQGTAWMRHTCIDYEIDRTASQLSLRQKHWSF